nr:MAG: hypothetical protein [Microvirus sp.]
MKRVVLKNQSPLKINKSYQGETIEQKLERIVQQKEPIKDGAPLVFTERKMGVLPEYNIRTDRFEVAIDAMTAVQKSTVAKREAAMKAKEEAKNGVTGDPSQ